MPINGDRDIPASLRRRGTGVTGWVPLYALALVSMALTAHPIPAQNLPAQSDVNAKVRSLQNDLTSQRAAALARERRLSDEREELLFAQLDQRDKRYRAILRDLNQTERERDSARTEVAAVITERSRLVEEIARRDRAYAAEVAEFRRQIAGLTETTNPALQAALQRYADGDRVGAFPVIEDIVRAENRAGEVASALAVAVRQAKGLRQVAALALDMKDRGEKTTAEVLSLWQEVQQLDPSFHWGWVELTRLQSEAGKLPEARTAAERALTTSGDERERSTALIELGDVLVAAGELKAARERFEQSLAIDQRLATANPSSAEAQRDVSVSLNNLGDVLVTAGDLKAARERFEQSLAIAQRLATANPSSAAAQRDVSVSLDRLGDVLVEAGELKAARERFEQSLATRQRLATANPSSAAAQRDVSVSLNKLGDVLVAAGELKAARERFEQSLATRKRLAAANPSSVAAQRDVSVSLNKLGDVLVEAGELKAARERFEQSLATLQRLATANPSSAAAQRDLIVSYSKLGQATGETEWWRKALEIAERLSRAGQLPPRDARMIDFLRDKVGQTPK
ncbi:MAG: tetratricopeptide repeat protein [Bryobacterales bacterium]|nr:tetratricopeptide repeat protein [Bryobacterales bacterium]